MPKDDDPRLPSKPRAVSVRGRVIAHIVPEPNRSAAARAWLRALRKKARVRDLLNASGERWNAERGRS